MNRSVRTFIVLVVALGLAGAATFLVYRTIQTRPVREVEVAHVFAVVAAHPLQLGARLTAADVKLVPWPAANPVPGGFTAVDQIVNRGVVLPVAENEPLTSNNIAQADAGAGLPPTIPQGMRALSVRVNEVIGVAGFVVPGTRVDVLVILHQPSGGSVARVVVSNVQVLTAGTRYDQQEVAKEGKAIPSSVVTLMLSPEDAERVGLATNEGQLLLTLRNPLDTAPTKSAGVNTSTLLGGQLVGDSAPAASTAARPAAPARKAVAAPPPASPAPPKAYMIEIIRGAKRSEETIK
jgi:pilus assembly protein CpaB